MKAASQRSLRRFPSAAAKTGGKVLSAQWEPLGIHYVFDGQDGGWRVKVEWPYYGRCVCIGTNIEDTICDIEWNGKDYLRYKLQLESKR